jgi:hypothetical protein
VTDDLPPWWPRWTFLCTDLIKDKKPPDPKTDVPFVMKLVENNPDKDVETVFREATNFLLGHNADGEKPYKRARSFLANQFNKEWGGIRQPKEIATNREWDDLDARMGETDMPSLVKRFRERRNGSEGT